MVRESKSLRVLDLVNTKIGSRGLEELTCALLAPDCTIERLYLGGNGFDGEDARQIAELIRKNTTLTALMLNVNQFSDAGAFEIAAALSENETLKDLGLASNSIQPPGVAALAEAAQHHPQLLHLDLGYAPSTKVLGASANRLGHLGSQAIATMLRQNQVLQRLSLARTGMNDKQRDLVSNAMRENQSLIDLTLDGPRTDLVRERLEMNREKAATEPKPMDVQLIRSIYRTAR